MVSSLLLIRPTTGDGGAVVWGAVISQQGEEQQNEHTPVEWLSAQHDGAGCIVADLNCLQSPIKEVLQPITKRGFRGRLTLFVYQLLGDVES